ncbi:Tar ligand binding domain-containing protein [Burkholderia cenocepacia]
MNLNALFSRFSIRTRIFSTLGLVAVLLVVSGLIGLAGMQSSNRALDEAYTRQLAAKTALSAASLNLTIVRTTLDRALLHPEAPDVSELVKKAEGYLAKADTAWRSYAAMPHGDDEGPLASRLDAARQALIGQALKPMIDAIREGRRDEADRLLMTVAPPLSVALTQATDALDAYQAARGKDVYDTAQTYYGWMRMGAIAGIAFGLAACLGCAIGLHFAITQPVNRLLSHFRRLSEGDLTSEVRWSSRDEMAELVKGVTGMQRSLADTVRQVSQGSEAISTATHQIAAGNTDLSQRTEEQASALQETAASMEQLTATVKQNADHALEAQACADSASEIATRGATVVGEVIGTMNEIDQSSQKVADIIGTIEGIAFQTNILALNAAVEAARGRAGPRLRGGRGRGAHAGTALGVRGEGNPHADRRIGRTGRDRLAARRHGRHDDAGHPAAIGRVTGIMTEIAAASSEQRDGIEQVNRAVSQMDQVSQQNAALVEQAAAAAASLEEQADGLRRAVGAFRVA